MIKGKENLEGYQLDAIANESRGKVTPLRDPDGRIVRFRTAGALDHDLKVAEKLAKGWTRLEGDAA